MSADRPDDSSQRTGPIVLIVGGIAIAVAVMLLVAGVSVIESTPGEPNADDRQGIESTVDPDERRAE